MQRGNFGHLKSVILGLRLMRDPVVGKTFVKWKLGWTNAPDLLENWLGEMAAAGNHLVRIKGARFVFQQGEPKQVSYVYDFQLKTSLHYFDIHKSDGWKLIFFSP